MGRSAQRHRNLPVAGGTSAPHAAEVDTNTTARPGATDTTDATDATDATPAPDRHRNHNPVLAFAMAVPIVVLIMAVVVDISMNYSEGLQARSGTVDADRDLTSHRLTATRVSSADCWLDELTSSRGPDRAVACATKARLRVDDHRSRVRIMLVDADGHWTSHHSPNNSIVVCTQVDGRSATGLLGFLLDHQIHQNVARLRIAELGDQPVDSTWERPLSGTTWAWCQPDSSTL